MKAMLRPEINHLAPGEELPRVVIWETQGLSHGDNLNLVDRSMGMAPFCARHTCHLPKAEGGPSGADRRARASAAPVEV